jgi:histidine triad (HIT) family protein
MGAAGYAPAMPDDCIFCAIATGDAPAMIVAEDDRTVAFMDIAPATRGHLLVIPRAHSQDLLDVDPADLDATMRAAKAMAARVHERLGPDGINLLNSCGRAAWQTVFHFHVHVIPRYEDDPLQLPWKPAEGDMEEIKRVGAELADRA